MAVQLYLIGASWHRTDISVINIDEDQLAGIGFSTVDSVKCNMQAVLLSRYQLKHIDLTFLFYVHSLFIVDKACIREVSQEVHEEGVGGA